MATRAEADKEIATLGASARVALDAAQRSLKSAQTSLEQEQAIGADLRWAVEQAKLEGREQADLLAVREELEGGLRADRERLEAEVVRQQAIAVDLQRAAGDLQRAAADAEGQLEKERRSSAELRQSAEHAATRLTRAERELADERSAHEAALADLTEARVGRDEIAEELARERKAAADREETDKEAAVPQQLLAEARQALAEAQAELQAARTSMTELRQAVESADQQFASARSNEAQAVADYETIVAQVAAIAKERDQVAVEPAPPPAPSPVAKPPAKTKGKAPVAVPAPPQAAASAPKQEEPEDGWQAVRLADRYQFNSDVSVQVNGNTARLFDISTSGCQLISPTALKPNQNVKVLLPVDETPVTCAGKVAWTRLEPMAPGEPLGYRAGIHFTKADEAGIEAFAARYLKPA